MKKKLKKKSVVGAREILEQLKGKLVIIGGKHARSQNYEAIVGMTATITDPSPSDERRCWVVIPGSMRGFSPDEWIVSVDDLLFVDGNIPEFLESSP